MFDLNFTELMVVAVVAIIVVGPKDLPRLMRTVGQWVGKVKRMARDFQRQLDDAVRDEELADLQKQVKELSRSTDNDIRRGLQPLPDRHAPSVEAARALPDTRAKALAAQTAGQGPVMTPLDPPVTPVPEPAPAADAPAEPKAFAAAPMEAATGAKS